MTPTPAPEAAEIGARPMSAKVAAFTAAASKAADEYVRATTKAMRRFTRAIDAPERATREGRAK